MYIRWQGINQPLSSRSAESSGDSGLLGLPCVAFSLVVTSGNAVACALNPYINLKHSYHDFSRPEYNPCLTRSPASLSHEPVLGQPAFKPSNRPVAKQRANAGSESTSAGIGSGWPARATDKASPTSIWHEMTPPLQSSRVGFDNHADGSRPAQPRG